MIASSKDPTFIGQELPQGGPWHAVDVLRRPLLGWDLVPLRIGGGAGILLPHFLKRSSVVIRTDVPAELLLAVAVLPRAAIRAFIVDLEQARIARYRREVGLGLGRLNRRRDALRVWCEHAGAVSYR
jgi:hypothetical protein